MAADLVQILNGMDNCSPCAAKRKAQLAGYTYGYGPRYRLAGLGATALDFSQVSPVAIGGAFLAAGLLLSTFRRRKRR